jgi:predicted transcriptional regulator of viral defense system
MNGREAFARLRRLGVPVIETADAAAALEQTPFAASKTLARLRDSGLVAAIRHGTWWLEGPVDPYRLPVHLTAPLPSYLSLQTALQLRGLIEQIPEVFYVVSLARSQRIETTAGSFSVHHVAPELFGGFDDSEAGVKLATPEKALFDLAYLSGGRSRRFASLPELEIPAGFRTVELRRWVERIPSTRGRTRVTRKLEEWLKAGRKPR